MMSFYRKAAWFYSGWQDYTKTGFEETSKNFFEKDLDVSARGKSYLITGQLFLDYCSKVPSI